MRGIEDAITAGSNAALIATTTPTVALYILNSKRAYVTDMEARHGYPVTILGADRIHGANFTIERGAATPVPSRRPERAAVNMDWGFEGEEEGEISEGTSEPGQITVIESDDEAATPLDREAREVREGGEDGARRRKRRRRRGRRGERGEEGPRSEFQANSEAGDGGDAGDDEDGDEAEENNSFVTTVGEEGSEAGDGEDGENVSSDASPGDPNDKRGRRRRRGRRGGRRGRGDRDNGGETAQGSGDEHDGEPRAAQSSERPGFEPQPDIARPARNVADEAHANGHNEPRRQDRPQRPERVWDVQRHNTRETGPREPAYEVKADVPAPVVQHREPERHIPAPAAIQHTPPEPVVIEVIPSRPRHETGSSEPRIERVVVKPGEIENGSTDAPAAPQRKGWWQRKFSGE